MLRRRTVLALPTSALATSAWSQGTAGRPVRLVVGFAPGGAADSIARVIAQALGRQLGQQVIVENKPGADGILAAQDVQRAAPDGHTLLWGTNTAMVQVPSTRAKPPYDPFKAFTPIGSAGQFSMFLVTSPSLKADDVKALLDEVAAQPDRYNAAFSNSAAQLAMIQLLGPRKAVYVRYKGDVPALTDLVGGHVHMIWTTGTSAPAFVKDGRAKALLTLQPQRSPLLPEVATAAEAGLGELTIRAWAGVFGPAGMPPEIVVKLNSGLQSALKRTDVKEQLAAQGFESYGMGTSEFAVFFKEQYDSFNRIVRDNHIRFE